MRACRPARQSAPARGRASRGRSERRCAARTAYGAGGGGIHASDAIRRAVRRVPVGSSSLVTTNRPSGLRSTVERLARHHGDTREVTRTPHRRQEHRFGLDGQIEEVVRGDQRAVGAEVRVPDHGVARLRQFSGLRTIGPPDGSTATRRSRHEQVALRTEDGIEPAAAQVSRSAARGRWRSRHSAPPVTRPRRRFRSRRRAAGRPG